MNKRKRQEITNRITYLRMVLKLDSLFVATIGKRQQLARLCLIEGAYSENAIINGNWEPRRYPMIEVWLSPTLTLESLLLWTDALIQGAALAPWN